MLLQRLRDELVDGPAKLLDQRRDAPEDMGAFHKLVQIVADPVEALQEGGIAGTIGLEDSHSIPTSPDRSPQQSNNRPIECFSSAFRPQLLDGRHPWFRRPASEWVGGPQGTNFGSP